MYIKSQYNLLYDTYQPYQLCSISYHTVTSTEILFVFQMNLFSVLYNTHDIHMLHNIKILGHIRPRPQFILFCLLLGCAVTPSAQDVQVSAKLCQYWFTLGLHKLRDVHAIYCTAMKLHIQCNITT